MASATTSRASRCVLLDDDDGFCNLAPPELALNTSSTAFNFVFNMASGRAQETYKSRSLRQNWTMCQKSSFGSAARAYRE